MTRKVAAVAAAGLSVSMLAISGPAGASTADPDIVRVEGADRYATSVQAATLAGFGAGTDDVILASGTVFADAMAASALAGAVNGPIVLTDPDNLSTSVANYLGLADPTTVHILGGDAAISPSVEAQVEALGYDTNRIAGEDRYETAADVANLAATVNGGIGGLGAASNVVFLAKGMDFPDALGAGSQAFEGVHPILLTPTDSLSPEAAGVIDDLNVDLVVVLGGPSAVSADVVDEIEAGGVETLRIGGLNRYETAANLASTLVGLGVLNPDDVGLASGLKFPDALSAAPYLGTASAPLVLVNDGVPAATQEFLEANSSVTATLHVFGGTAAISADTAEAAADAAAAVPVTAEIAGLDGANEFTVAFSESVVEASAETIGNYSLNNTPLAGVSAVLDTTTDTVTVTLAAPLDPNDVIRVSGVQTADGRTVTPTSFTVAADVTAPAITIQAFPNNSELVLLASEPVSVGTFVLTVDRVAMGAPTVVGAPIVSGDSLSVAVTLTSDLLAGDKITLAAGSLVDVNGNANALTTSTVVADNTAPALSTATVALEANDQASYTIDGTGDVLITAKEDGIADGAAGNAWRVRVTDTNAALSTSVNNSLKLISIGADLDDSADLGVDAFDVAVALTANTTFSANFTAVLTAVGPFDTAVADAMLAGGVTKATHELQFSEPLAAIDPALVGIDLDGDGFTDATVAGIVGLGGVVDTTELTTSGLVELTFLIPTNLDGAPVAGVSTVRLAPAAVTDFAGNDNVAGVVTFTAG